MTQGTLSMDVRRVGDTVAVLDIEGEITAFCEDALMDAYTAGAADGTKAVILNFTGLEYMNSGGIGLLVTVLVRANRAKQKLLAYGLTEHYKQIFELTRLNEAIGIYDTEDEAVTAAGGGTT
jgi:anti-sigma B factor antagonist